MGRERRGAGEYLYICAAGLILALLAACAPGKAIWTQQERCTHLGSVQHLLRQGDFEGALRENRKALAAAPEGDDADIALFDMGLIHAHYANPKKDYAKALESFRRLRNKYPRSPLAEEAKIWIGVLETMEKAKQIDIEIEEKKKGLTR